MDFKPRYYQQEGTEALLTAAENGMRRPLIVLPTGAGKAPVCAMLSDQLRFAHSSQKILMLVPTQELVVQNREKLEWFGIKSSIWCSSVGPKSMKRQIVIGTPQSVANHLDMFTKGDYACAIMDEAHTVHPTNQMIIQSLEAANDKYFTCGLTATPWTTENGWIFKQHYLRGVVPADEASEPFFDEVVYEVDTRTLINEGYLSPPFATAQLESYDEKGLKLNSDGKYTKAMLDKVYSVQEGRTARIMRDVVMNSRDSRSVLIFAASKKHAMQVLSHLPPDDCGFIDGTMRPHQRKKVLTDFKEFRIKYLVNVNVLTTGFDHPWTDHVVILRAMESVLLWQQMVGRGLRIAEGKLGFQISDYGGNIDAFFPDGEDIFSPTIKAAYRGSPLARIDIECPVCAHTNSASVTPENLNKKYDRYGYMLDLFGERMELPKNFIGPDGKVEAEKVAVPVHLQQRCSGMSIVKGERVQCDHYWNYRKCGECGCHNAVTARQCRECGEILLDVAKALKEERAQIQAVAAVTREEDLRRKAMLTRIAESNPHEPRSAPVQAVTISEYTTRKKTVILQATIKLPRPLGSLIVFMHPGSEARRLICEALFGRDLPDATILKRMASTSPWLRPRELDSVTWRVPRAKQQYPDVYKYEVKNNVA